MFLIGISSVNIIEAEGNSSKGGYAFAVLDGDGNLVFSEASGLISIKTQALLSIWKATNIRVPFMLILKITLMEIYGTLMEIRQILTAVSFMNTGEMKK